MLKSAIRGCFLSKTVRSDLVLTLRKMSYTSARVKAMALFVKHEAKFEGKHKGNPFHKIDNPQAPTGELNTFDRDFNCTTHKSTLSHTMAFLLQGIINMGTSENKLLFDLLKKKFEETESHTLLQEHTEYFCAEGLMSFRQTIADFLNHYMKPAEPISSEELIVSNGATPLVDAIAYTLADEGEGMLIPAPYYGSFLLDLQSRSRVIPFPVELSSKIGPGESQPFELTVKRLESALQKAQEQGVKIRGVLLCNPNNPLGVIYSEELLQGCLQFAARHSLHVIMDEIYMLSLFKEGCSMTNVLSLKNIPDKERLHVLWGFSKDFGVSGFRCGIFQTRNKEVYRAMAQGYTRFQDLAAPTQVMLRNLIKDRDWLDKTFIPTNQERLRKAYNITCNALREVNIPFIQGEGGLFVWVDFRELVPTSTFEEEYQLFERMVGNGVSIYPGAYFLCPEPGWFRIIFAMDAEVLQLGLSRIQKTVKNVRTELAAKQPDGRVKAPPSHSQDKVSSSDETLEDLIHTLNRQIKDSDWLKENTAEKWVAENPELAKAFLHEDGDK